MVVSCTFCKALSARAATLPADAALELERLDECPGSDVMSELAAVVVTIADAVAADTVVPGVTLCGPASADGEPFSLIGPAYVLITAIIWKNEPERLETTMTYAAVFTRAWQ